LFRVLLLLRFVRGIIFFFPFEFILFLLLNDLLLSFLESLLTSPAFLFGFGLELDVADFFFDEDLFSFVVLVFDLFGVEARVYFSPLVSFFALLLLILLLLTAGLEIDERLSCCSSLASFFSSWSFSFETAFLISSDIICGVADGSFATTAAALSVALDLIREVAYFVRFAFNIRVSTSIK
jgi:hypothetical protein